MAFIRNYKPSDFDATAQICRETFAPNLVGSDEAWRVGPYVWTHQYTHLSPSTCFILDDGTGRAVGYCIGCPDIPSFIADYDRYVKDILERPGSDIPRPADTTSTREPWRKADGTPNGTCLEQLAYNPTWLLKDGNEDLEAKGYRATMHIDLLEGYQGQGWGRKLIDMFVGEVKKQKKEDTKGIFIGIATDNAHVVKFYEKLGFKVVQEGEGLRMTRDID